MRWVEFAEGLTDRKRWEVLNHGFTVGQIRMALDKHDRKNYYIANSAYSDGSYKRDLGTFKSKAAAVGAIKRNARSESGKSLNITIEQNSCLS